jgi:hypothetical protein
VARVFAAQNAALDLENSRLVPGRIRNNIALLLLATNRRAEGERLLALVPSQETRNAIRREAQRLAIRPERRS